MPATNSARDIFLAALDRPAADRAAYLDAACGGDAAVRQRVEALLRADDEPGAFLSEVMPGAAPMDGFTADGPVDGRTATFGSEPGVTADFSNKDEHVGAILGGKYKLIEEIGEGGMGSVYIAQQTEPVKRAVAVKVIKAGMDSKAVLARFEAERQALAMMDHPNIARVLDAGTTESGRPYFVMELVDGVPITEFCDERKLTPKKRLELFVPVCNAIQHAHQKGVIHRDIKPSNVLVAMYDERPVPKVIDFGVAKAAGQTLTDKTLMTGFGAVVGTPEYMSPEQASLNNLDIDTRSDVYSLGVLLYELLTGTTPVDRKSLGKAALLEVLRIVREVEAPPPSSRVGTAHRASKDNGQCPPDENLPSVAANRGTEPSKLSKLMRGELDWVVLKAIEKDRTRRYESANGLARDIQRYLADEVVEARPPSTGYRLRKFVTRHKGQVIAACLVLFALLIGLVTTTHQAGRARVAEQEAWENARQADKRRGEAERAEGIAQAQYRRAEDSLMKARKQTEIAEAVKDFLERDLIAQANPLDFGENDHKPDPELKLKTALDRAVPLIAKRFEGKPLVEASIRRAIGKAYLGRGLVSVAQSQLEKACELYRAELTRADQADVEVLVRGPYIEAMLELISIYPSLGQPQKALATIPALEEQVRLSMGDSPEGKSVLASTAAIREVLEGKDPAKAIKMSQEQLRKMLGEKYSEPMETFTAAMKLMGQGKYPEAEVALIRLIEPRRSKGGVEVLIWTSLLGEVYRLQGKYAEARTSFETSRDGIRKLLGEDHPCLGSCHYGLALTLLAEKKYEHAETESRAALDFYERLMPDDLIRFEVRGMIGSALMGQKKYVVAEPLLLASYEGFKKEEKAIPALGMTRLPAALDRLIELYTATNKPGEVEKYRAERAKHPAELAPLRGEKK